LFRSFFQEPGDLGSFFKQISVTHRDYPAYGEVIMKCLDNLFVSEEPGDIIGDVWMLNLRYSSTETIIREQKNRLTIHTHEGYRTLSFRAVQNAIKQITHYFVSISKEGQKL